MQIYNFSKDNGKKIGIFNSNFIMSRIIETNKGAHIGCMYLEENGIIGYHQATIPQLLLILDGEGYVCDEKKEYFKVRSGDSIFWEKNEWHETKTETGLTAIVIESEELNPSLYMPKKHWDVSSVSF
ncbi:MULTISPECIES: cupin domain-containing protein [Heyndrickxia]|uniref:Cupin n=1 Tax=Heyndrickxia shackletonii TaxID=157838 RepID=A0A0Q3X043_9BACI|nr:cupin [Heyndrickxia shackletonii]KQL54931.1 cupin [Heyndrickxia shackletonii]MBB2482537.1 cupin [Bacillus sp. APMAM]NEY99397.1 cupin domain-containing protein [Heyndrickxia shackletonii]RTZ54032.1 cupin [Bacillus sp. SAJ1]